MWNWVEVLLLNQLQNLVNKCNVVGKGCKMWTLNARLYCSNDSNENKWKWIDIYFLIMILNIWREDYIPGMCVTYILVISLWISLLGFLILYFVKISKYILFFPGDDTFSKAVQIVITWLERGDCSKRNAGTFYSMIQSTNSHVRRLMTEKSQYEEELAKFREQTRARMQGVIMQCEYPSRYM